MEPLIAYYFPTENASRESQRERAALFPPSFYLHLWWARRPLAASRATIAALAVDVNGPPSRSFVAEFLNAVRLTPNLPRPAYNYAVNRDWVFRHSRAGDSVLLDLFSGGGSIAFEALRMGFKKVVAVEYNPVAYIILKATLEYPLRYGKKLVEDVRRWAEWLAGNVRRELEQFYPPHPKGRPTSYVWVRVYTCPEGVRMPSLANPILSRNRKIALKLEGFDSKGDPVLRIVSVSDVNKAKEQYSTIHRKRLKCPRSILDSKELQRQYREAMKKWEEEGLYGHHPAVLAAVKLEDGTYVEPTPEIIEAYRRAEEHLRNHWGELVAEDLIPIEAIPEGVKTREVLLRGMDRFYKLFNARQLLLHAAMVKYIREAYSEMLREGYDREYARAVTTYLAIGHGRLLDYNSAITIWDPYGRGSIGHTFSRHTYQFGDDFGEGDIVPGKSRNDLLSWAFFGRVGVVRALERIVSLLEGSNSGIEVVLGDASDAATYAGVDRVDYVVADPPYYDNVQYGELSDFFYVWLKRSIGDLYPEAFTWDVTPKDGEIVVNRAQGKDGAWFEERLTDALSIVRELGAKRLAVMYAHRSSEGLYAMFKAILEAGWKPVGVWGVASEQPKSQHIVGKAAARTMLIIGAVPREKGSRCFFDARFQHKLRSAVEEAVRNVLRLGLGPVDAFMAGVGAAFKLAGGCWPLLTPDGRPVSVKSIIDEASSLASDVIANEVLKAEVDKVTMMYFLARIVHGEPEYDDLRRLGYATGYSHEEFIARFTRGSRASGGRKVYSIRSLNEISLPIKPDSLVEALAVAVRRFLASGVDSAVEALREAGYGLSASVCRLVEVLLEDSSGDEKKALQGIYEVCIRGKPYGRGASSAPGQRSLLDYMRNDR
ncbi:hypothetical protein CF15_05340 [Pyrodictium occultum]|uniref:DUF1156 domain-containing protein n=1 Tax=Pyrodictium occultum TaxID=2309 RepID=A0A0V8RVU2_PYROC|nr:DUF1156 domain-containing protein [Pyrodictium occultum]KSW12185.1 hypothetical protein CF15_05340 [Pyrodictium occultum]